MSPLRKISNRLLGKTNQSEQSFAQAGEDRILWFLAKALGLNKPSYLDIGAFDPWFINNTAVFYNNGSRGWNVEPNKRLYNKFLRYRKGDNNLCMAIGGETGEGTFFEMDQPTLSTISKAEAERLERDGISRIVASNKIQLITLKDFIHMYCSGRFPDILCIDTEGLEEIILQQLHALDTRPAIICAETAEFAGAKFGRKRNEIIELTESAGYKIYADTFINTIFLKTELWM